MMMLIIGMISRMKNIFHKFILFTLVAGLGISACTPINNPTSIEPTPSIPAVIATSTPKISPTMTAINNECNLLRFQRG